MLINATVMEALRQADQAKGAIHTDSDALRTIRLPGAPNMTQVTDAARALTGVGITVIGYGANLTSPHDDFVGGTIQISMDEAREFPVDTRQALRA